ncbi:MAG TPA: hypothetical protein VJR89_20420 [Polyangiales bacterium]|nr:hypothetical protein [Polyangiales bacterium]
MIPLYPKSWQRAAILATIAAIGAVGLCAWPYTVDDAFIVARYAWRLAHGQGYTFNPGPPTDGVTGPLWLAPGWLASLAQRDPVWAAKIVGLCCTAISGAALVGRLARRARGTSYACAAALLLSCQPTLGAWGVAGLETGTATLAVTVAWLALTARPRPRLKSLAAALAVLPWLRPELTIVACAFAITGGVRSVAALGASLAALASFRGALFDSLLPLAYHAKQASLAHGADYALRGVLIVLGVAGVPLAVRAARSGRRDDRLLGWVLAAHLGAVVLAGGDWMPGFRLFAPLLPLALGSCAVGALRPSRSFPRVRVALLVATALVLAIDLGTRIPAWRQAGASREGPGRALAERLRSSAQRVALVDVGFLVYASGVEAVDLGGITDPAIAALPGAHLDKRIPETWLTQRNPDALILHSAHPPLVAADARLLALSGYPVEQRVANSAWVRTQFKVATTVAYAPHYYYVLMLRR